MPLHAAGVVDDSGNCALVCAAVGWREVHAHRRRWCARGWRALGDDKLLVRESTRTSTVRVAALLHTFNLHPATRSWFPEVGDLECLPTYSAWTEKRKVSVGVDMEAIDAPTAVHDARRDPGRSGASGVGRDRGLSP